MTKKLVGNFSSDGNSSAIIVRAGATLFLGSSAASNFGGGTVTVQVKGPDPAGTAAGLWYNSADTYTAGDVDNLVFAKTSEVRLNLASSTSPDLDYAIVEEE